MATRVFLNIPKKVDSSKARAEAMGNIIDELDDDIFNITDDIMEADAYYKWLSPDRYIWTRLKPPIGVPQGTF